MLACALPLKKRSRRISVLASTPTVASATGRALARNLFVLLCIASPVHAEIAGVPPAMACNYLTGIGLPTTTYLQLADGSHRCSSPPIEIGTVPGKNGRLNRIVYSAIGSAQSISALQLTIDVDNPDQAPAIHRRLKDVAATLAGKLKTELPGSIQSAIASGSTTKAPLGKQNVAVIRTDRADGSYEIKVVFD